MKDLYTENYKTLVKETEDTNKWKDSRCSWIAKQAHRHREQRGGCQQQRLGDGRNGF